MDIEQMIALAMIRGEQEYAEMLLEDFSDKNLAPVYSLPDYARPEKKQANIGYMWA